MPYKKVTPGATTDTMWNGKDSGIAAGAELEGTYIQKEEKIGPNNANIYVIESDGAKVGVWGSTSLDMQFELVPLNSKVKILYHGTKPSEKRPGKSFHNYELQLWSDE